MNRWTGAGLTMMAIFGVACSEPGVHVVFEIPPGYRDLVVNVSLQVLAPPEAAAFDCDDVAFQEVSTDTVRLSLVQERVFSPGASGPLSGIPRVPPKLFLVQGLDAGDTAVVAGCAAVGEINGDETVIIPGEPTAVVTLPDLGIGGPLPPSVPLVARDHRGQPLAGVDVRWTVVGPAGETRPGDTRTDGRGEAVLQPARPSLPGPALLDVQVRWDSGPRTELLAFHEATVVLAADLPGDGPDTLRSSATETLYRVGRIGPQGQMGFVALGPESQMAAGRTAAIVYYDPTRSPPFVQNETAPLVGVFALGMVSGPGRDQVVTMSPLRWMEIQPDGSVVERASPVPGKVARRFEPAGGCGPGQGGDVLVVAFTDSTLAAVTPQGQLASSPFVTAAPSGRLVGGGCAAGPGGEIHRALVYADQGLDQIVLADMDTLRTGGWSVFPTAVTSTPDLDGFPSRLVGTTLGIDGTQIVRGRLLPLGNAALDVEITDQDETPSFTLSSAAGDLDGDGAPDLVSVLDFGPIEDDTQFRLLVTLGATWRGHRIKGISGGGEAVAPRVFVADFDEDGFDDLLIAGAGSYAVVRMGP